MFIYLVVFCLLFLISSLFSLFKKRLLNTIIPLLLCVFIAILFCSVKGDSVGPDTIEYHKFFDTISNNTWKQCFSTRMEIGFAIFTKLISSISGSFIFYNIVFYSFVWGGLALFAFTFSKKQPICFSLIFLFSLQFALTAYRQMLAVSMIAIAMSLFKLFEGKIISFIFFFSFFVIGFSFHTSTIACAVIPICYIIAKRIRINIYFCCGLFLAFIFGSRCIYYLIAETTSTVYAPFTRNSIPFTSIMALSVFLIGYLLNYSSFCQTIIERPQLEQKRRGILPKIQCFCSQSYVFINNKLLIQKDCSSKDAYLKTSALLSLVAACIMSFSLITTIITRIYVFFEAPLALVIINTISNRENKVIRAIGYLCITFLSILYFYISLVRSGYLPFYVPYETIF